MRIKILSKRGMGLIPVIISAGILGVIALGALTTFDILSKQQRQMNLSFQASIVRNSLVTVLNNSKAWKNTIGSPANNLASGTMLDCLENGNPCTTNQSTDLPAGGIPIGYSQSPGGGSPGVLIKQILDPSGVVVLDSSSPTNGYTAQGTPCTTFDDNNGNDACPLKYEVRWWAKCNCKNPGCAPVIATDSCVGAQPLLQITAKYKPSSTSHQTFNPANYGTPPFIQGQTPDGACWQMIGTNIVETCAVNVGIGTATPAATLDVNGGIHTGQDVIGNPCAGQPEGTIKYDIGAHAPIFCNQFGTWAAIGGGPVFGGTYIDYSDVYPQVWQCLIGNPYTGGCNCPAGYNTYTTGYGADTIPRWYTGYICFK